MRGAGWIFAALVGVLPVAGEGPPFYTAAGIVNGATFTAGPLAPNGIASIFGTDLSYYEAAVGKDDMARGSLPSELGYVRVVVDGTSAPLYYVSRTQINFLVPVSRRPREVTVQVYRQGLYGPAAKVQLVDAAPVLFRSQDGYLLASHGADYTLVTRDAPAAAGEVIVLWGTGFGATNPALENDYKLPTLALPIAKLADLQVTVADTALDRGRVLYCGVTPGFGGLYQLNLRLPDQLGQDPEIRVSIGGQSSPAGAKLAVGPGRSQLSRGRAR